ncbi:MAG: hypothetical protein WC989_08060 [Micavibrio sp.]
MDHLTAVIIAKIVLGSLAYGLIWHHASIIKALKSTVKALRNCSLSDILEFLKLVFIKIPGSIIAVALVLLIIALPFIFTGPVGGMIIWACIVIIWTCIVVVGRFA